MKKRHYSMVIVLAGIAIFSGFNFIPAAKAAGNSLFATRISEFFGLPQIDPSTSFVPVPVSLPAVNAPTGATISVPITTGDLTGLGVYVYELQVTYDPAILTPASPAFDTAGTLSSAMTITPDTSNSGHLIIEGFQGVAMAGAGTLINLRFTVIGTTGQSTALTFADYTDPGSAFHPGFRFNEGDPTVTITNGSFTVVAATATATNTATNTPTNTPATTPTFTPTNTATATATGTPAVAVALPIMTASPATVVLVPITVGNTTGLNIFSYDLQVTFNPAIITPASPAFDKTGTVSSNMFVTPNAANPGHLIISAFDVSPLTGSGTLLNLRFNVIGSSGQSTDLIFEDYTSPGSQFHPGFVFNGGSPPDVTSNGVLTIATATPTATNTATATATSTFTPTATSTSTFTPTATSTSTFTPTATSTSTFTPTATSTSTFTPTFTATSTFTPTATSTATFTPTFTPTVVPTPILGNYTNAVIPLSTNTTVTPDAAPLLAASMNVSTSTNFKGKLEADPTTGIVTVTNAHPAGIHLITVTAFGFMGVTNTRTFTLTVNTPPVCNPVSFAPAVHNGTGTGSEAVVVGDFNGDAKQDLAVANESSHNVSILLGNGSGSFGSATNFGVGNNPKSLAVGDFNGDGNQDLAVVNLGSSNVSILLGDGFGSFSNFLMLPAGGPEAVAVGDFNGDNKQDLVVVNDGTNNVSIMLGNGDGNFTAPTNYVAGTVPHSVALGDFNEDGNQDLAISNWASNNVSILLGVGNGSFGGAINLPVDSNPYSIAVGDFNGDGKQDLVTANREPGTVTIILGLGLGNFSAATNIGVGGVSVSVALGDFNGDGKLDIAVDIPNSDSASILLGDGVGGFSLAGSVGTGDFPYSIAVGDFNGDGKQDLVTANIFSNNLSVLLRDCTLSGTVTYGNAIGSPSTRYVSNVQVNAAGTPSASATTLAPGAGEGTYKLDLLGAGPYTVTPSKVGGVNNAINSFDAARIAAHVTGNNFLTGNQFVAADVSGNNAIQSFDAAQIARYVTALTPYALTGTWKFFTVPNIPFPTGSTPTSRTYPTLTSNLAGEDYTAILLGDVSGNWNNTGARGVGGKQPAVASGPERSISVELPDMAVAVGKEIVVPVRVDNAANKGIVSYEFELRYDASVIQPLEDVIDIAGTASRGLSFAANANEPGILRVALYGAMPIDSNGLLLNLRFKAVGEPGAFTPLTWQRIMFNDGQPRVSAINGRVRL
ncbi:MAG: VCBS repeat-containing protein [Chloracidobacterium sp.]|nr:VCBS repeat-containing protein [Chloracidobacterium sp.]